MTSPPRENDAAHHDDTQELILTVLSGAERLAEALRGFPGIADIRRDQDRLDLRVDDAQAVLAGIVAMAHSRHIPIASVLVYPDAFEVGGLDAQLLAELHGDRGEGELP